MTMPDVQFKCDPSGRIQMSDSIDFKIDSRCYLIMTLKNQVTGKETHFHITKIKQGNLFF